MVELDKTLYIESIPSVTLPTDVEQEFIEPQESDSTETKDLDEKSRNQNLNIENVDSSLIFYLSIFFSGLLIVNIQFLHSRVCTLTRRVDTTKTNVCTLTQLVENNKTKICNLTNLVENTKTKISLSKSLNNSKVNELNEEIKNARSATASATATVNEAIVNLETENAQLANIANDVEAFKKKLIDAENKLALYPRIIKSYRYILRSYRSVLDHQDDKLGCQDALAKVKYEDSLSKLNEIICDLKSREHDNLLKKIELVRLAKLNIASKLLDPEGNFSGATECPLISKSFSTASCFLDVSTSFIGYKCEQQDANGHIEDTSGYEFFPVMLVEAEKKEFDELGYDLVGISFKVKSFEEYLLEFEQNLQRDKKSKLGDEGLEGFLPFLWHEEKVINESYVDVDWTAPKVINESCVDWTAPKRFTVLSRNGFLTELKLDENSHFLGPFQHLFKDKSKEAKERALSLILALFQAGDMMRGFTVNTLYNESQPSAVFNVKTGLSTLDGIFNFHLIKQYNSFPEEDSDNATFLKLFKVTTLADFNKLVKEENPKSKITKYLSLSPKK